MSYIRRMNIVMKHAIVTGRAFEEDRWLLQECIHLDGVQATAFCRIRYTARSMISKEQNVSVL
ncbi:MAG: hypothetical protein ACLUPF_12340 [Dorea sp.]